MSKIRRQKAFHEVTSAGSEIQFSGTTLTVLAEGTEQSRIDFSRPEVIEFDYLQRIDIVFEEALAAWGGGPAHPRIFHAGAGGCSLPLAWDSKYAEVRQVGVDLDKELLDTIGRLAGIKNRKRLRLRAGDAKDILNGSVATYDVIVRDAFIGPNTPRDLTTLTWMQLVKSRLNSPGLYMANAGHGPGTSGKADVAGALQVFPDTGIIADPKVWRSSRIGNLVIVSWQDTNAPWDELDRQVRRLPFPVRLYRPTEVMKWLGGLQALPN